MTNFDFNSIYILLLNIFFIILFVFLVFYIFSSYKSEVEEEKKEVNEKAYKKALQLIEDSQVQALSTIKESNKKAQEIIKSTQTLSDSTKEELQQKIETETAKQIEEIEKNAHEMYMVYHTALEKETDRNLGMLHKMLKDMETEAVHELDDFKKAVKDETVNSEKIVQDKINKDYEEVRSELDLYRDDKYKEIDKDINTILYKVSTEVLGKALDLETHQQLVLDSLEQAKKDALFG